MFLTFFWKYLNHSTLNFKKISRTPDNDTLLLSANHKMTCNSFYQTSPNRLGWPKKRKILNFSKNMKYVSYMIYLRPMIILESLKYPPGLCTINFNFTKGFAPKYKGNICILVFWRFSNILFLRNDSKSVRSFCLIDTLLLIPILP